MAIYFIKKYDVRRNMISKINYLVIYGVG